MDNSESHALNRLRAGDSRPFTVLMQTHADRLVRAAFMLCGEDALARDLAQETFCRALAQAGKFRGDSRLYTWLYGIMRRLCLQHLIRDRRRAQILENYPPLSKENPGPEEVWMAGQRQGGLRQAVRSLPAAQREIIRLRFVEEMKLAEIALALDIPQGTVKSRLHHALAALRGGSRNPEPPEKKKAEKSHGL